MGADGLCWKGSKKKIRIKRKRVGLSWFVIVAKVVRLSGGRGISPEGLTFFHESRFAGIRGILAFQIIAISDGLFYPKCAHEGIEAVGSVTDLKFRLDRYKRPYLPELLSRVQPGDQSVGISAGECADSKLALPIFSF